MALLDPTFCFGVLVLIYFLSFIVFALIRITTGISIQRLGYFSLRRIAYTFKDGVELEIRGLGFVLHRPTFAQPTWVSVVLTELGVTVDLRSEKHEGDEQEDGHQNGDSTGKPSNAPAPTRKPLPRVDSFGTQRSKTWKRMTAIKEKIKRLHRKINWIRMVDLVATNTTLTVVDVGQVQIGSFTMAVDTRRKMVDRGRMFAHLKSGNKGQRPAEWMMTVRSVLFTPDGNESLEVLDHATLNIHGLLYKELDGLRDAAIALKLGRIHIPYDDLTGCVSRLKEMEKLRRPRETKAGFAEISVIDVIEEFDQPGASSQGNLAQTVSDSKEIINSILRGIKEVQFAVSYVGFTKKVPFIQPHGSPIYINASMKEVGVDLHRLDQKSPAHRMYFASKDVAHQALLAALSISINVDGGQEGSDRLIYVPMATTTIRTTLPSKTVESGPDSSAEERNANLLFANVVITSPSIDLDPKHLPLVLALLKPRSKAQKESSPQNHMIISRLLPKTNVKFSMHEPVMRIALPPVENGAAEDDFDLIISSISSISLDIESSHSAVGGLHYSLGSTLRLQAHDLYYQTSSGIRHNLLLTESLDMKVQVSANPEVYVNSTCTLATFSIHMVRPEISDGVRQIVRQLRLNVEPDKKPRSRTSRDPNFIRAMPSWLMHFQLQGSDFSAEVAGVDEEISPETRGLGLQLESWSAEYRALKLDPPERKVSRRRAASRSLTPDGDLFMAMPSSPRNKQQLHPTDGRRLVIHVRGLEGFVIESAERWEPEPFIQMPRFETALSTASDSQGPVFHINSTIRTLLVQYSLYRHYACGVAIMVVRKAFVRTKTDEEEAEKSRAVKKQQSLDGNDHLAPLKPPEDFYIKAAPDYPFSQKELITIDIRMTLLQVQATMPSDPSVMLQIYAMEGGRHRWSSPFIHAKLIRLYSQAPRMINVWARIVSVKSLRADIRENRRMCHSGKMIDERMIDVNTEAIRLAVPHQLILHKVMDNFINTIKSTQQLHHRFATGTKEYILDKGPVGAKVIPKVSIRSKALLFELEDGAFEWKLGTIYRAGLVEQRQRLARERAFAVKAKKIEEEELRRDSTRYRNRSAHPRCPSKPNEATRRRSRSLDSDPDSRGRSGFTRGRKMRYDPEGSCGITGANKISIAEAHERLLRQNFQSWKKRIDFVLDKSKGIMRDLRARFWGPDQLPDDMEDTENILEVPQRPALMTALISDLHITIDKPSFPPSQLPEFMHRVGKGLPYDTKFSLLVPMFVQLDMGEARVTLRDYPLPLLHVPAIKPGQSPRVSAWSLKTDFVIGEEYQGPESLRNVKVVIIPPLNREPGTTNKGAFAFNVRRTVSPVKTYSDIKVNINTGFPTRITWGASYQPAIQDMMLIIESFTKPQIDPSDRVGFWDKIRLSFHSRLTVAWTGDGDVHLLLKGTRDPYMVTGNGAGFLMCWRNDVKWNIARNNDSRSLITVDSNEYILAIPDYSHQARRDYHHAQHDDSSISSEGSFKRGATFKKVVMKLSGNVQWMAGLMFERNVGSGGQRSFDFEPHYKVVFKEPKYAKSALGIEYDAFRGFRSNHIHMSIAVRAPVNREWEPSNTTPSLSYNTVHLTPRFFTHFFAWWAMFGGTMSLPIRQGPLWPGIEKSSKKFGRHLSTIKYNLLLAPLFLSHIYKHTNPEDYGEDIVSATGLKMRLDSFMLDMHQRREEFHTQDKGQKTATKTSSLKMHQAQLDLVSADIRAVSASIVGTTSEDLQKASDSASVGQDEHVQTDLSNFEIPDNDFSWIDMDDFIELDWILPSTGNPETKIMPLAYAPRFTYFRQTNHGDTISGDPDRTSPFGSEPTHFCVMSKDDDPRRVQCHLIENRLKQLEGQMNDHTRQWDEAELERIRSNHSPASTEAYDQLNRHGVVLKEKKVFLESMLHQMAIRIHTNLKRAVPDEDADVDSDRGSPRPKDYDKETDDIGTNPGAEFVSDFNNRFVIHNMQLKWNNLLRNIILRYIHQVSQRRGFVYYLSRRAVKFILDIVEEQNKAKANARSRSASAGPRKSTPSSASPVDDSDEMIREIIADGKRFVDADDPQAPEITKDPAANNMSSEFTPQNSYHLRLIAPQIQLQSEKNPKSVVLVTAKGMELKVVEVMDKDRMFDDVSGLVQRRFCVEMDSTQFFVTHQKWFSLQLLSMYSGVNYGTPSGSAWPPWVPMEVMFDFQGDPFGFKRVVQKTSASLRFDKYNTLRLKYNDEINKDGKRTTNTNDVEDRMDHLWVEFPQIRAICNSSQYYAMYIIVLDLLMYSEPLEKTRTERLERIMLASDFSDLSGAPDMVIRLQERIRQLDEIKTQFQINSKDLDKRGWEDRLVLDKDLASCEDELFFMMKAITTSQRKYDGSQTSGLLRWNISSQQIVWHLIRDNNEPLMEFQLQGAEYDRTDNSDGSHLNLMQIGKIIGLNLLDDAIYPEMFAPYADAERGTFNEGGNQQMLRVYWHMLEAIAGIPVMSHFEVNLFPMKIQLEREVGKKLFEYMFPGTKDDKGQGPKKKSPSPSPFIVMNMVPVEDDEVEEAELEAQAKAKAEAAAISSSNAAQQLSARPGVDRMATVANTRAGSLELRLKPTLTSEDHPAIAGSSSTKTKASSMHSNNEGHFRIFQSNSKSGQASRNTSGKSLTKKTSLESMKSAFTTPHPGVARSSTHNSVADSNSVASSDTKKRGFIGLGSSKSKKEQPSDDLTRMMARASNYMTLAYVKIPSVVLCLSYKGKGDRNIEDVHDFVFRLPMIEYRNKTWSNLDLALALKKDIIRALISHTGAIIGNKFSKHRPNTAQQTRLRELATSSMLLAPVEGQWDSDTSSLFGTSPTDNKSESRRSFASSRNGDIKSDTNSMYSEHSGNTTASRAAFANSMAMTKNYSGDGSRSTVVAAKEGITQAEDDRELAETQEGKHGFMANTIQRFRNGTGAGSSSSYIGEREGEGTVRKKPKSLLGNILGSSTQS